MTGLLEFFTAHQTTGGQIFYNQTVKGRLTGSLEVALAMEVF